VSTAVEVVPAALNTVVVLATRLAVNMASQEVAGDISVAGSLGKRYVGKFLFLDHGLITAWRMSPGEAAVKVGAGDVGRAVEVTATLQIIGEETVVEERPVYSVSVDVLGLAVVGVSVARTVVGCVA